MFKGLDPTQRLAATVLAGVALFFLGFVGSSYLQRPRPLTFVPQTSGVAAQRFTEGGGVTVHIVGAVARPDVYTLPAGTTIKSAIEAAGGALEGADLESINLASKVIDGTQVRIHLKGEEPSKAPFLADDSSTVGVGGGLVSINSATLQELDSLPGIGPVKAQAIIDYRNQIGGFKSIEELNAVKGIGDKTMDELRPLIKL